ncbi:hypothetical protein [Flammeovirga sp. SJP92]|uniref:hypothetical protein n=1 Tax=Flammeovirga sp. SJP92 TaxID=1775430 RepID=UPI00078726BE|nr:hypothetical protein [Flammeovirga sp. SJP92]KXX68809.1 hypothetical protein AVL50_18410 [Flammeovirga sp. SJP92]
MKHLLILFLTASLLFSSKTFATVESHEKVKNYTIISVILTVQYGDGYFQITRRLFKALHLPEKELTWKHVQYIKEMYNKKYDSYDLKVGNEITILKSEFIK